MRGLDRIELWIGRLEMFGTDSKMLAHTKYRVPCANLVALREVTGEVPFEEVPCRDYKVESSEGVAGCSSLAQRSSPERRSKRPLVGIALKGHLTSRRTDRYNCICYASSAP
jgi:hypothetical protein